MDSNQAQVGSMEEELDLIVRLAHATDGRSRLRLRQLILKESPRSTCSPAGITDAHADAPARVSRVWRSNRNPKDAASANYSTGGQQSLTVRRLETLIHENSLRRVRRQLGS